MAITDNYRKTFEPNAFLKKAQLTVDRQWMILELAIGEDVIAVRFDSTQYCCEQYGIIMPPRWNQLLNCQIAEMEIGIANEIGQGRVQAHLGEFGKPEVAVLLLKLQNDLDDGFFLPFYFYNLHEGYYGHTVECLVNGKEVFRTVI